MANEWAKHGVNVNAIAPGYVKTDLNEALQNDPVRSKEILSRIPAGRWGAPDDFKGPVVYLASRASDYVHGELSVVDGGWLGKCAYWRLLYFANGMLFFVSCRSIITIKRFIILTTNSDISFILAIKENKEKQK